MRIAAILLLLVLSMTLYSAIVIEHSEPFVGYRGNDLKLDISLTGSLHELKEMNIYYRERGDVAFTVITLDSQAGVNGDFIVNLPISKQSRGLEYYIEVVTINEVKYTYPQENQTLKPISVQVIKQAFDSEFVVLSDLDNIEAGNNFSLSISLYNLKDKIDLTTIKAYRNRREITKEVIVTPSLLVYNVEKINHNFSFQVTAQTLSGELIESEEFQIRVKRKMFTYEIPYNIRGNVNYRGNTNNISYDDKTAGNSERATNSHSTVINASGDYKFLSVNSRLFLSSLESSEKQSINRYMFEAQVPHLKMYLGDTSPYLSEYTLNNTNLRGVGSKLRFQHFFVEGYWGNSARDISTKFNDEMVVPGAFKRQTGAVRLAFGNENVFQFGINLAKNKDKISSLKEEDYFVSKTKDDPSEDAEEFQILNPVDNVVFSSDFIMTTPRRLFTLGAEFALSAYNSNIVGGAMSKEELEDDLGGSIPFNPESIENFFIINKNTEPFGIGLENMALKAYTNAYVAKNFITFAYSRVGSAFNSLSARNVRNDVQEISVTDNINFFNTLFVDLAFNRVSDNLSEMLATTNEYNNYHISSVFKKEKYPIFRANFSRGQTSVGNNDTIDMGLDFDESQEFRTTTIGGGVGYGFELVPIMPFTLDLDYAKNINDDDLRDTFKFENDSYIFRYKAKFIPIPLSTELSYNLTKSTHITYEDRGNSQQRQNLTKVSEDWNRNSVRIKLAYEFLEAKLIPFFDFRYSNNTNDFDKANDYSHNATSIGVRYSPLKLTSINSSLSFKNNSYEIEGKDYSAVNWYLNILQKF